MFAAIGSFAATICSCLACGACRCTYNHVILRSARAGYTVLFLLNIFIAFLMRDFARKLMNAIPGVHFSKDDDDVWYGAQAVYRIAFGNFMFFTAMSLILIGTKYKQDKRHENVQHGNWPVKLFFWFIAIIIPFFIPGHMVWFEWIARIGSAFYLVLQTLILLDFVYALNDAWFAQGEQSSVYLYALLGTVIVLYAAHGTFIGLGFHYFKPDGAGACVLNVSLWVWTIVITVAFSVMSVLDWFSNGSLFPSSVISAYCGFLCFTAMQSEPEDYDCNGLANKDSANGTSVAVGLLITLVAVIYSALRAGSNTSTFRLARSDDDEAPSAPTQEALLTSAGEDGKEAPPAIQQAIRDNPVPTSMNEFTPVPYNYSFFHMIFSLSSLYVAMLLTSWGTDDTDGIKVGVSWTSMWVKMISQIFTAWIYIWTLIAPVLFPDRDFN
eukprot:g1255.t1